MNNINVESKLHGLIKRIEMAAISDTQKEEIYLSMRQALEMTVTPVLVSHIPQESYDLFNASPTPEGYCEIVRNAFRDDSTLAEIDMLMGKVLDKTEAILITRKIIH